MAKETIAYNKNDLRDIYKAFKLMDDQARAAVDLYTQALVAQAITSRYIDEIANKTK